MRKINIKSEIDRFNKNNVLKSRYSSKSFSEILLVNRSETSHSSFLAWMLNPLQNESLKEFPIKKLLNIILLRQKQFQIKEPLFDDVSTFTLENIKIETEKYLKIKKNKKFVDLYIELKEKKHIIKIVIENKVASKEHNEQTVDYYNYFVENKKENEILVFVFLTPIPTLELNKLTETECVSKEYIQINYQDLVDYIIEPAMKRNISERTKFILSEYLSSLSRPSFHKIDNPNQKQDFIMAIGQEEKELLANFWKENENLILSAMYANSINAELEEEVRELNKKTYESFSEKSGIGVDVQRQFKELVDLGFITNKLLVELCNENFSRKTFNIGYSFLRKESDSEYGNDINGYSRYYKKKIYTIFGNNYMLCNHWTAKNIGKYNKWVKLVSNQK
ncbi:PD-(D/E)XK nuclease family protein [Tenacibaculum haliotis]|uniref:PD-(D/E)XK nuclease family protein n=1 Tax=Tenacibaculum haliotis TaxID=1888914 RepID=UPI0021B05E92|nr:PD-(D/E)XK nuclease family protein [Tenacibaculum haliotis]MCT4697622.1 PD-(D/E)XK nuclease family protein [Tenacibaculum haliotis]